MIYTIKKGDTLSELAVKFGTTTEALVIANAIKDPDKIYAGDTLIVPGATFKDDPWSFDLWDAVKRWLGW